MNVALAKDEVIVKEDSFTTNLIFFWLKTNFILTSKRVVGRFPNTLFGLIPLGRIEVTYALKNVAGVASSTRFHLLRFILGIFMSLAGLWALNHSILIALIFLLPAVLLILTSYTTTFVIANNAAGQAPVIELSILERGKAHNFVVEVNSKISEL